jgi:tungstate transport system substrate-binding protein
MPERTRRPRPARWILLALTVAAASADGCRAAPPSLVLATTTSVANTGVLDPLTAAYETEAGITIRTLPVGSGRALRLLSAGQADVAVTHAPAREAVALREHPGWTYRKIFFNDFVIVGPPADPAGVAGASDAADAMRRVAAGGVRWVSRGDESGTHEREGQLWRLAGVEPASNLVVTTGQGMSATLRIAGEMAAYTLTDRATFTQLAPRLRLALLHAGDPRLLNTYAVTAPSANERGSAFLAWLTEGGGRDELARLAARGDLKGFELWPAGRPGTTPESLPR